MTSHFSYVSGFDINVEIKSCIFSQIFPFISFFKDSTKHNTLKASPAFLLLSNPLQLFLKRIFNLNDYRHLTWSRCFHSSAHSLSVSL